jgi:hypothetical protein
MGAKLLWYWYTLRWWTPEAKTCRAVARHGRAVYEALRQHAISDEHAEAATQFAFDVLLEQYRLGANPPSVRQAMIVVALSAVKSGKISEAHECSEHS